MVADIAMRGQWFEVEVMPDAKRAGWPRASFRAVKIVHTVVWAFFASSTLAIVVCALAGAYGLAAVFVAIVTVEVLVLALNGLSCPLTAVTARYRSDPTDDRDIYLVPRWLARHNKLVFGTLYLLGILLTVVLWAGSRPGS